MVKIRIFSNDYGEIDRFLSRFYNTSVKLEHLKWENEYKNPIEIAEIVGTYSDNSDKFNIEVWVSLDKNIYIHITDKNADDFIKYLFERFPY